MFVDRGIHIASGQVDILNELTATSTDLVLGADEDSGETLWSRLKELAQNFVDGVLTITGIKTNLVESDRVETSELCVDDVCVTADDLRALLQGATTEESASETHTADQTQTETAPVGNGDTSETNEPVATSTQQSASTTPEMVTEAEAQETSTTSVETEAVAETTVEIDLTEEENNPVVETESPQEVVVEAPEILEEVAEPEPAPAVVQEPVQDSEPVPSE